MSLCRATHQFHLQQQPLVKELVRLADRDRNGPSHKEKYIYSEHPDYSPLGREPRSVSDRSRASSIPASGARDREGSDRMIMMTPSQSVRGASSPPTASGFYAGAAGNSSRGSSTDLCLTYGSLLSVILSTVTQFHVYTDKRTRVRTAWSPI